MPTTHDMDEAAALCDRVGIMDGGRLLVLDDPASMLSPEVPDLEAAFLSLTCREIR